VNRVSRLDLTGFRAALILALLATLVNAIWILLDHSTASWDQSHYLRTTLQYQLGFEADGVVGLARAILNTDPSHGPLFTVAMLPFLSVFGASAQSGLLLNFVLAPILYVSAGQIAWIVFRDWRARLLAIVLVATMPLMVGLYHNVLQDFLLVSMATLSILLLLMSERFQRRGISLWAGLAMGLGTLTKVTFPLFMVGPLLVIAAQALASRLTRDREGGPAFPTDLRRLGINLAGTAGVYLLVILPWYGPNFQETRDYVSSTTSGPLAAGAGPEDPFTFDAVTSFTTGVVNANVTWVIALAALIAIAFNFSRLVALFRKPARIEPLLKLAFLAAWVAIPFLSVALAKNQDVRLMAPAMPGMAVITAGAICAIRPRGARLALAGVTTVAMLYLTVGKITPVSPAFLPEDVSVQASSYNASIPLKEQPIGYEQLPGDDYGTPVVEYIEELSEREGTPDVPKQICLLQSEPVVNSNSFGFLALAREDPFAFADVLIDDQGRRGLATTLKGCNFALYVPQAPVDPALRESRLAIVNEEYAARYMTPKLLRLFPGPRRGFPVAPDAEPSTDTGSGDWVIVLAQNPAGLPNQEPQ